MQFSEKIGNSRFAPNPLGLAPPPLGNPGSATESVMNTLRSWSTCSSLGVQEESIDLGSLFDMDGTLPSC